MTASANRRRVLIVSHVFPPHVAGGAPRMGQFARLLPQFGWDVTVLTSEPGTSSALDRTAEAEIAKHARIVRAWSPVSKIVKRGTPVAKRGVAGFARKIATTAARSVFFPDREILWAPRAIEAGRRVMSEIHHDIVLATIGPASNLIVGRALAKKFNVPLVVDFRDLWSTQPVPIFPTPLHRAAAQRFERSMVRRASRVIGVAPAMALSLADVHGFASERAVSITNGFDPLDLQRVHDAHREGPFRLMYSGVVHAYYNLDPLWTALKALATAGVITPQTFRVEFVGNLSPDAIPHGMEEFVDIHPFVPRDQVFDSLARADALLIVETTGYYAQFSYAAKVFDYILTGKPVVGLVDLGGNTDTLLSSIGVGHCVATNDASGMERVLRELVTKGRQPPRTIDPDARPIRDFNRLHLAKRLGDVLEEVVTSEPHGLWT